MRAAFVFALVLLLGAGCGDGNADGDAAAPGGDAGRVDAGGPGDAGPDEDAGDAGGPAADGGAAADAGPDAAAGDGGPGDGGPGDGGAVDPCSLCVDERVRWEQDIGGAETRYARVEPCRDYADVSTLSGLGGMICSGVVPCTGEGPTIVELRDALADPDVQAAVAAAPVEYGSTAAPTVPFVITIGDAEIRLGSACGSEPSCTPIPAGVAALEELLGQLETTVELECMDISPPGG
jgi:hypothetical protein